MSHWPSSAGITSLGDLGPHRRARRPRCAGPRRPRRDVDAAGRSTLGPSRSTPGPASRPAPRRRHQGRRRAGGELVGAGPRSATSILALDHLRAQLEALEAGQQLGAAAASTSRQEGVVGHAGDAEPEARPCRSARAASDHGRPADGAAPPRPGSAGPAGSCRRRAPTPRRRRAGSATAPTEVRRAWSVAGSLMRSVWPRPARRSHVHPLRFGCGHRGTGARRFPPETRVGGCQARGAARRWAVMRRAPGTAAEQGPGLVVALEVLVVGHAVGHDAGAGLHRGPAVGRARPWCGWRWPCRCCPRSRCSRPRRRTGPRLTGSRSSMISMARTLGAPDTVPAGSVARSTSIGVQPLGQLARHLRGEVHHVAVALERHHLVDLLGAEA